MFICAIQNTDFNSSIEQIELMVNEFQNSERNPPIQNAQYFSILPAFQQLTSQISEYSWEFEIVKKRKQNIAFLIGITSLET